MFSLMQSLLKSLEVDAKGICYYILMYNCREGNIVKALKFWSLGCKPTKDFL